MIISPTEPPTLRAIGSVSMLPEEFGCDILFATPDGWAGVQRKEFKDLIASIEDGRLAEQIAKMKSGLTYRMVVIEGWGRWTVDGELLGRTYGQKITLGQVRKVLWSVRREGVWVDRSEGLDDTIRLVEQFEQWAKKTNHKALRTRPAVRSSWGKANNRDYQLHLLQGIPGIGPELAERILDQVGMPIGLKAGMVGELGKVKGLGKSKIKLITDAFDTGTDGTDGTDGADQ